MITGTYVIPIEKRLHVILNNTPMKIERFDLKPLPLVFDEDKKVIVVVGQDKYKKSA